MAAHSDKSSQVTGQHYISEYLSSTKASRERRQ